MPPPVTVMVWPASLVQAWVAGEATAVPLRVRLSPFCALMVPSLVQLVPFRVMVPAAVERTVGSAVIVPLLSNGTLLILIWPAVPLTVKFAPG